MQMLTTLCLTLGMLAAPTRPTLVVANMDASTVSIVDLTTGTILATLPTGHVPHEVAASADGRWAVVTDYGDKQAGSTLTIVDLQALTVARTIELLPHRRPHGAAFLPDNRTVAITSETSGMVLLVNVETGKVTGEIPTGQKLSHMLAVGTDGRYAYTANVGDGSLSMLNLGGGEQPRILPVSVQTEGIGLTPGSSQAWLGSNPTGKVYAVDLGQWKVIDSIQTSGMPYRIGFTPDGTTAVITNPMTDEVQILDARTRQLRGTVKLPAKASPQGLTFSPDGTTAWITLGGSAEIAEIDLSGHSVRRHLPAGAGPDGIAYVLR